jgi:hypothetical protein
MENALDLILQGTLMGLGSDNFLEDRSILRGLGGNRSLLKDLMSTDRALFQNLDGLGDLSLDDGCRRKLLLDDGLSLLLDNLGGLPLLFKDLLVGLVDDGLVELVNDLLVAFVNDRLMDLMDLLLVDHRLMVLVDHILVMLMHHVLVVLVHNILVMLMNHISM